MDFVFTSARMSAFSPTVSAPSELISPSTFPSIKSSFWNLIVPLISTSLERTSLLESSAPELSDPSPIDEIVFCGMNFFNTRYYCNGYSHCQRVRGRKAKFFTIYSQNGTILQFGSAPKESNMAGPASASGRERDRAAAREPGCRGDQRNCEQRVPNHRLKPIPHADYTAFHVQ